MFKFYVCRSKTHPGQIWAIKKVIWISIFFVKDFLIFRKSRCLHIILLVLVLLSSDFIHVYIHTYSQLQHFRKCSSICFPNRTYIRKTPFPCALSSLSTYGRATAGYVLQKWRVARTSDLASIWHSSSDSSEFRVTGVSLSFELPVSCAAVMIWQRVRFDSDPIIRWLWCRWMTYESVRNIAHITKKLIFFW